MREKYVRKRKNRTKNARMLENERRPTVIVESLTSHQLVLLNEAQTAWKQITGKNSWNFKQIGTGGVNFGNKRQLDGLCCRL